MEQHGIGYIRFYESELLCLRVRVSIVCIYVVFDNFNQFWKCEDIGSLYDIIQPFFSLYPNLFQLASWKQSHTMDHIVLGLIFYTQSFFM